MLTKFLKPYARFEFLCQEFGIFCVEQEIVLCFDSNIWWKNTYKNINRVKRTYSQPSTVIKLSLQYSTLSLLIFILIVLFFKYLPWYFKQPLPIVLSSYIWSIKKSHDGKLKKLSQTLSYNQIKMFLWYEWLKGNEGQGPTIWAPKQNQSKCNWITLCSTFVV